MNAGIPAHFSPTIKCERDKWLRFVNTHLANFNPSGKFVAGMLCPFPGGMFFKSVSYGRLSSSAYSWLNSYKMKDRARKTTFQMTPTQGKPCLILSKLQYCVSHAVFFFVEVSCMFIPKHLCDL